MENTEGKQTKKVIELEYPIPVVAENGAVVEVYQIELGRMKAKHLKLLPADFMKKKGNMEPTAMIPLIGAMANLPESSIDELDMTDLIKVGEEMERFLSLGVPSPRTGKK